MKRYLLILLALTEWCWADPQYFSETKQDEFVNEAIFNNKRNGVFIDIGAHAGIQYSNTYFFERNLGWTGICFEPNPSVFQHLVNNRRCICIPKGVSNTPGFFTFVPNRVSWVSGFLDKYNQDHFETWKVEDNLGQSIQVETILLNDILEQYQLYHVDLLSIDTEGGELDILKSIDFNRFQIDVIVVENKYDDEEFESFLQTVGYILLVRLQRDQIYLRILG